MSTLPTRGLAGCIDAQIWNPSCSSWRKLRICQPDRHPRFRSRTAVRRTGFWAKECFFDAGRSPVPAALPGATGNWPLAASRQQNCATSPWTTSTTSSPSPSRRARETRSSWTLFSASASTSSPAAQAPERCCASAPVPPAGSRTRPGTRTRSATGSTRDTSCRSPARTRGSCRGTCSSTSRGGGRLRVDGHRVHRKLGRHGIVVSTLDFEGELRVTDPEAFLSALSNGIGPAKAFGCGLMLVRRLRIA